MAVVVVAAVVAVAGVLKLVLVETASFLLVLPIINIRRKKWFYIHTIHLIKI